jgi:hypothetical protein
MYFEEKVVDGVLHWRNTPDGTWHAYTAMELTGRLAVTVKELYEHLGAGEVLWVKEMETGSTIEPG